MKSLNEKNSSEDVEAGLQIQEEINDNNNSTKVNEISDTSETDKLVNSNPVQKSVLPPSYSKMLKKLKIWISGIFWNHFLAFFMITLSTPQTALQI